MCSTVFPRTPPGNQPPANNLTHLLNRPKCFVIRTSKFASLSIVPEAPPDNSHAIHRVVTGNSIKTESRRTYRIPRPSTRSAEDQWVALPRRRRGRFVGWVNSTKNVLDGKRAILGYSVIATCGVTKSSRIRKAAEEPASTSSSRMNRIDERMSASDLTRFGCV